MRNNVLFSDVNIFINLHDKIVFCRLYLIIPYYRVCYDYQMFFFQERAKPQRLAEWSSKDETKSRFSQYSMSSSVIRRNQGLSLLDNRFERVL